MMSATEKKMVQANVNNVGNMNAKTLRLLKVGFWYSTSGPGAGYLELRESSRDSGGEELIDDNSVSPSLLRAISST